MQEDYGFEEKSRLDGQERFAFGTVKAIDQGNPNLIHATVSTDEIDRYDEIVLPSSFVEMLSKFKENPCLLAGHRHNYENGQPPVIGNVLPNTIRILEHRVDMDILFDDEDELAQKYARKYRKKIMRAFSIGFRGLEGKYEQSGEKKVWTWTKIECIEVSCVAVPANTGALSRAERKAAFLAEKIAKRKADFGTFKTDEQIIRELKAAGEWPDDDDAFGLIGLSRTDFTPEELEDFSAEELLILDQCIDIPDNEKSVQEPDYSQLAKSRGTSGQNFYQE